MSVLPDQPIESQWPTLKVHYQRLRSQPRIAVITYDGDYEMSLMLFQGIDLFKPVESLYEKGYRYFIFDLSRTRCFDHPYGIGQFTWLLRKLNTERCEFTICGPSHWFEEYITQIVPIEMIRTRYFPSLPECIGHLMKVITKHEATE